MRKSTVIRLGIIWTIFVSVFYASIARAEQSYTVQTRLFYKERLFVEPIWNLTPGIRRTVRIDPQHTLSVLLTELSNRAIQLETELEANDVDYAPVFVLSPNDRAKLDLGSWDFSVNVVVNAIN
jgi:hypothetical protein